MTFGFFSCSTRIYFFNIFNLDANKDIILHLAHCIISSLSLGWNSFIFRLFQHVMSLTYQHVLTN
jgi:hypothetical protein